MKLCICFFASERYWKNSDELYAVTESMKKEMILFDGESKIILNEENLNDINGDIMIAVPMSGAIQTIVVKAAEKFNTVCIYPGYIQNNFAPDIARKMLLLNAAPAVMDIYSVLKRQMDNVFMCLTKSNLSMTIKSCSAYCKIKDSKLLLIGDTEPWVISASKDLNVYKNKFGIVIECIPLETMIECYNNVNIDSDDVICIYDSWCNGACEIEEPSSNDIMNASRFCVALKKLIEDHNADGAAIACFSLINQLNITACLAVSYTNNNTKYIAACEGDTDSAVTMFILKNLTDNGVWMANPNLLPDNSVNFVHCTAPINICGNNCIYRLRNHHESGIGVSTEVIFPDELTLTACRISDNASKITIQNGIGCCDIHEETCRTQYRVKFDDFDKYINTVLGCHQIFAFEDLTEELKILARMFRLEIL